jgi:1-phosphofructokinase family hexose kinase
MPVEPRLLCVAPNASVDRLIEVDRLVPGRIHRPDSVVDVPGGKGLNVARAAAALGGDVVACAILAGNAGRWIADSLQAEVGAVLPVWSSGETRTCISILSRGDESLTELYPAGEAVASGAWEELEARVGGELSARPAALTVSGSLPPGVPSYGVARLVRIAHLARVRAYVDTHGEALALALAERPDVVKVNADEAAAVLGMALQPGGRGPGATAPSLRDLADGIAARSGATVVVTNGRQGCVAVAPHVGWVVGPVPATGPYGVGSEDAFLAGLAVTLEAGGTLEAALRVAVAASVANALLPGAGRLDATRMAALVRLVEVSPLP